MNTQGPTDNTNKNSRRQARPRKPLNQRTGFWLTLLFILIILNILRLYYVSSQSTHGGRQQAPVVTAQVKISDVPVYLAALGAVTPTASVTVKSQINGQLISVLFKEGQMVKVGDLLAEIDSRPYEAQLTQYAGQLARDRAQLVNANLDLKRYQLLWKQNSISQQVLATQEALVKQIEGTIQLDEGLVEATKVSLAYCKISSPINGRIGLRNVDPGNVVQTSDVNGIALVNTLDPITVVFAIAEDSLPQVLEKLNAGVTLAAESFDRQQNKLLATGKLLTADNQIDPTTGTIKLKAQFENANNALFPSQFVNVRLLVNTLRHALVVPTAAIQNSTTGNFVYVLNKELMTVKMTPVVTGITTEDTTIIKSGVTDGAIVIVEGTDKLTDGATVTLPDTSNKASSVTPGKKRGRSKA